MGISKLLPNLFYDHSIAFVPRSPTSPHKYSPRGLGGNTSPEEPWHVVRSRSLPPSRVTADRFSIRLSQYEGFVSSIFPTEPLGDALLTTYLYPFAARGAS